MAEVDAGDQALVQGAQLQHLLQIPQLVDLAHGLGTQGDVAEALAVAGPDHLPQGAEGCVQRLPTGALHQGAGVDHNPGGPHLTGHQAGGGDIADGLLQAVRVRVGQIDEIRGMEREGDPVLPGVLPYPPGGVLPHMDPLAALIFVAVQPLLRDPLGGGQGGLVDGGESVAVAGGPEFGAHRKGLLLPSRRKGVSAA